MAIPQDYAERVYAGVLGKIIGVYLGRPIEGWSYEEITDRFGEMDRYVHKDVGMPLVVTDDDISGTFTFLRAMPDRGNSLKLTAKQIGLSWLNYLIEERTILWWGGIGNSTEHTAFIRLKEGVPAPLSGSEKLNGKLIAEQIGAQIFIDGFGMIFPNDPERAVDFARRAGSVSHDGEAIYGAQIIAAMEAAAFGESDLNRLLDTSVRLIPDTSVIYRLIHDIRNWHAGEKDWRKTRKKIVATYGYDKYGGNCHMVPNHALIIHSLLHGDDDFSKSQLIVNTAGWDTDCNAGNVGCIMGIKNGLAGIDAMKYDWRGPVADRMYLAAGEGGRAITDAVIETYHVVNIGRAVAKKAPLAPKDGARFHFSLPGSVQGFEASGKGAKVRNGLLPDGSGERALSILSTGTAVAMTPTFVPEEAIHMKGYTLLASPTLYSGQKVTAKVVADPANKKAVTAALRIHIYDGNDQIAPIDGPSASLKPGASKVFSWVVPNTKGLPVAAIGVEVTGAGTVHLDRLGWSGAPKVLLERPKSTKPVAARSSGEAWRNPPIAMWRRAWLDGVDQWEWRWPQAYRIVKNQGTGLIAQGTSDWENYRVGSVIEVPLATEAGIAARVGGQKRWYGLLLCNDGMIRLVREMDGRKTLASASVPWSFDRQHKLELEVDGETLTGYLDGTKVVTATDSGLRGGGVGLVVTSGCSISEAVAVSPL
ncbi:MAG: ADP-ribosylglycohydrolase family protein [Chloroflexota bacterium]